MRKGLFLLVVLFLVAAPIAWAADESHGGETAVSSDADHGVGASEGEQEGGHEPQKYFGIPAGVLKFVNLVVFLGFLTYLVRKPIKNALAGRREGIQKQLSEAALRRQKADSLAEDIQARLSQIEGEVGAILARAREEGEKQKAEIVAAAEAESKRILATAKSQIDQRVSRARRELTDYAGQLAAERAQKMIESDLTDQDRATYFDESVDRIGEMKS